MWVFTVGIAIENDSAAYTFVQREGSAKGLSERKFVTLSLVMFTTSYVGSSCDTQINNFAIVQLVNSAMKLT